MVQAIPMAIAIGGSLVKGIGANAAYKASARADEANATGELNAGADRELRIREAARASMGRLIAAQAESGFTPGTGTALDELAQSQINATLDALQSRREAASRAEVYRARASSERKSGTMSLISAGFNIASTIAGMNTDWAAAKSGKVGVPASGGGGDFVDPRGQGGRRDPLLSY